MCKFERNLFLPKASWIYLRGIGFHSRKFLFYSLCIHEHFNAKILCFISTLFKLPSANHFGNRSDFRIVIFGSSDNSLMHQSFLPCHKNFVVLISFLLYEICTPNTLNTFFSKIKTFHTTECHIKNFQGAYSCYFAFSDIRTKSTETWKQLWWNWYPVKRMLYRVHTRYISIHDRKFSNHEYFYLF